MLKLVLCCEGEDAHPDRIKTLIQTRLPWVEFSQVRSVRELALILGRPLHGISMVVSFVANQDQMAALGQMLPLLENSRLILILPRSSSKKMLSSGLRLAPSFVTHPDSDEVVAVLEKLYQREKKRRSITHWERSIEREDSR